MVFARTLAIRNCAAWLVAGAMVIGGCAPQQSAAPPSAVAPGARPAVGLMQIKSELLDARSHVATTNDALNVMAKSPRENLRGNYQTFSTQYFQLQTKVNLARSRAYDLKSQATAYNDLMVRTYIWPTPCGDNGLVTWTSGS